ncbi:MAG TPA: methanogen output domain 1-containing protein [Gammaproteobacteria bacterium]|jgi:predicted ArsR family transcriptional regulator
MAHAEQGERATPAALNETGFLRKFIRHITGTLEDVVGLHESNGFVATVAQRMGEQINETYRQSMGLERLNPQHVTEVFIDLQKQINGNFSVTHEDEEKIVITGCACPFGKDVVDRPSLCTMTSNMLAVIAAENLGYAKVSVEKSLARGDSCCRIVMYLKNSAEAARAEGREFFQS